MSLAGVERRRMLRQIGLRASDLDSVGRALLLNWARASAALRLLDDHAAAHGWLDDDGDPRGFARFYVSLLNAERHALKGLADHVRVSKRDAAADLDAYLRANHG